MDVNKKNDEKQQLSSNPFLYWLWISLSLQAASLFIVSVSEQKWLINASIFVASHFYAQQYVEWSRKLIFLSVRHICFFWIVWIFHNWTDIRTHCVMWEGFNLFAIYYNFDDNWLHMSTIICLIIHMTSSYFENRNELIIFRCL